ncbi:MAG TPA: glycoside hydrolase family 43 protein [Actinoplanes sp.]|nr:glycoside hydrolase family 43 protein [Actinoplanes sp.]
MSVDPVIPGMFPDPSVCRVGDDYYLACSSFEYVPGVPILHSRDLLRWELIGHALDTLSLPPEAPSSGGVYAPTLRFHDGLFWLITTNVAAGGGSVIVTATDPAGPWSEPIPVADVGIDPDLAWDEDGNCWCTSAGVGQVRLDPYTGKHLSEQRRLWSGAPGAKAPEAPHLYRIGEYWYLLIAEGGTERGHAVSIARGPSPEGPFEACPANPILTHRGVDHPVQNTGHADLVQAADGTWWMVFLGVRPGGGTPGWHVLGRETFLAPVTWSDGWPVVGPVTSGRPGTDVIHDDFPGPDLHPRWISVRSRPRDTWSAGGGLTLHARDRSLDDPQVTFVGLRQQHPACRVRTSVTGTGGLAVRLDEHHHYEIETEAGEVRVVARLGTIRHVAAARPVPDGPVLLGVDVIAADPADWDPRKGPDVLRFGLATPDGGLDVLAELDGRYLSTEVAGGFTGRVIGMYAGSGTACFDWFRYEPVRAAV